MLALLAAIPLFSPVMAVPTPAPTPLVHAGWAWDNVKQMVIVQAAGTDKLVWTNIAVPTFHWISLAMFVLVMLATTIQQCLTRFCYRYSKLDPKQQAVTASHVMSLIVLGTIFPLNTYWGLRFLYRAWDTDYVSSDEITCFFIVGPIGLMCLYAAEGVLRSLLVNWFLIAHHGLTISFFFATMYGFVRC